MITDYKEFISSLFENSNSNSHIKVKIQEIPYEKKVWKSVGNVSIETGSSKIVKYNERPIILLDINGVNVPFYQSTGLAGKKSVEPGKWYPVLGIGDDGWINKGSQEDINNYYGIPILKYYSELLDSKIGNVLNKDFPEISITERDTRQKRAINRGLNPCENGRSDTLVRFKKNLESLKEAIRMAIKK